ncbi:MAG: replication-associated recombination protein A [Clostridiales bacterium]|nr:replication-associated recombination protein A [Clostridiales bacterium]MDR2711635.1 replication-associated recombination protein A [Clostridiales bacterium]
MPDLFSENFDRFLAQKAPLAARMRPRRLQDLVGQEEIIGPGRLLRRAIEADKLSSVIFYGPPGSGKTTLAQIIAGTTKSSFREISAVTAGIADIREILKEAKEKIRLYSRRTVLFIDEIHRFNKSQQDALLPAVEQGLIILIGATTENPYFEVNGALLSRSRIFHLQPLSSDSIMELLRRALTDKERGLGNYKVNADEEALRHLADTSNGDARNAYNALELAVLTTPADEEGCLYITLEIAGESIQAKGLAYDKGGDWHYDIISAFIKSMRGSDPDAALHWLARMIEAGEKPEFIARRIVICAAEDVGLADPQALVIAMAAAEAARFVGWPEARIPLAEAVIYISCAPKSNSAYLAIDRAAAEVRDLPLDGVPGHLQDASYRGAKQLGHGQGYLYPHDHPGHYINQQYLPDNLQGHVYYQPSKNGREEAIGQRLAKIRAFFDQKYKP